MNSRYRVKLTKEGLSDENNQDVESFLGEYLRDVFRLHLIRIIRERERERASMEYHEMGDKLVEHVEEVYDKCVTLAERVTVL